MFSKTTDISTAKNRAARPVNVVVLLGLLALIIDIVGIIILIGRRR